MDRHGRRPLAKGASGGIGAPPAGRKQSMRRRIAVATWRPSTDGRIYTRSVIDATAVLAYVQEARRRTGEHVTITHVVGAALGRAIRAEPEVRARVVFGRIMPLETCDIGFAVDIDGGHDLAPVKVRFVDQKTPADIARELASGVSQLRSGTEPHYARSTGIVRRVPSWALRPLISAVSLLSGGLGIATFGQPGFPLGCAFVSNVGTLGLDEAFMAPLPFARVALYLAVGAVHDAPAVVDGRVVVRPQLVLVATGDHRLVDGAQAGRISVQLRELLAKPAQLDTPATIDR